MDRQAVAVAIVVAAGMVAACGQKSSTVEPVPAAAATTAAAEAAPVPGQANWPRNHHFEALPRSELLKIAGRDLGPNAPNMLPAGVVVTTRQPSAEGAYLAFSRGSLFDPTYGERGLSALDVATATNDFRIWLWVTPNSGRPTIVDCDIAGNRNLQATTQIFDATGNFTGETSPQISSTNQTHWTVVVPWNPEFSAYGKFRINFFAPNLTAMAFWGCEITRVN